MANRNTPFSSRMGALFIQPGGPNPANDLEFLDCRTVGDITDNEATYDLIRCHNLDRNGWDIKGTTSTPPDPVTFSIDELVYQTLSYLESEVCPFALYLMMGRCGKANIIFNYDRGSVLNPVYREGKTLSNAVHREEDNLTMHSIPLWTYPGILPVEKLQIVLQTTASTDGLNDVFFKDDVRCLADCDGELDSCEEGIVVGDSAVAPAFADVEFTATYGATWTASAADPFAAGSGAMSVTGFWVGRTTWRWLVGMEAPAGAQGMVAYSDDDGATWTTVNIGGAAAGHGVADSGGLFSLDNEHIWLAGAAGYIYFSDDGGETWTAQEAGVIHAGDYNAIKFIDQSYGMAVGAADVIAVTSDGGTTWTAATATGGGNALTACHRMDQSVMHVGDDGGEYYYSNDGGTTWTQLTGWSGSGVGDIADIQFVNEAQGFMVHNNATPVGTVLYTFTGGRHWEALTTPDNDGLNAIHACDASHAYVVGEVEAGAGVAVILQVRPQP